jgi:hypothetical protein
MRIRGSDWMMARGRRKCVVSWCDGDGRALGGLCPSHKWREDNGLGLDSPFRPRSRRSELCTWSDCNERYFASGLCVLHYNRQRKGYDMDAPLRGKRTTDEVLFRDRNGNKQCLKCREWLSEGEFKAKNTSDGLDETCRRCRLKEKYGLTPELFSVLNAGLCQICNRKLDTDKYAIDHDHSCCPGQGSCGKCVRGILCGACNRGLGHFRDSPQALRKAADYLEASSA